MKKLEVKSWKLKAFSFKPLALSTLQRSAL